MHDWPSFGGESPDGERLQKVLARLGFGSRRACEEMIEAGRVVVNGSVARLGQRVHVLEDKVQVDGVETSTEPGLVYYLVNKPAGVVCTSKDTHGRPVIVDLVPPEPRVFSVGRLDEATEGLIIVTNDGAFANLLAHPSYGVEKEYVAQVSGEITPLALKTLRDGVLLEDGITKPAKVARVGSSGLKIVIHEGRNRQVRRMCDAVGLTVKRLARTRVGQLSDRTIKPGKYREMTFAEVRSLAELAKKGTTTQLHDTTESRQERRSRRSG